uniref:Aminopeptidase n=1 Tax=Steinernema glaseri TaxID=37863 RepID=A0A1I8AA34_9BILA
MEEIDLSDRRGLIAMAEQFSGKSTETLPQTSNGQMETGKPAAPPKDAKKKQVSCASSTALLLFLLSVAAVVAAVLVTFFVTKGIYDHPGTNVTFIADDTYETTTFSPDEGEPEDVDPNAPTAEQLRLPKALHPVYYNLTIKPYLPGYVDYPAEKNLTFEATVAIKVRVEEATDKIVLSALKLHFGDVTKFGIFQESLEEVEVNVTKKIVKRDVAAQAVNVTTLAPAVATTEEESEEEEEDETTTVAGVGVTAVGKSGNSTESEEEEEEDDETGAPITNGTASTPTATMATTLMASNTTEAAVEEETTTLTPAPSTAAAAEESEEEEEEEEEVGGLQNVTQFVRRPSGIAVKSIDVKEELEQAIFQLDKPLEQGQEYLFEIKYTGPIDKKLAGLYLSHYTDEDGDVRYAAITQCEPTDARRMVPCFDEPEFKAVWKINVVHPTGTTAVSNGIEVVNAEATEDKDWVFTSFKETLPMSPYLLALAVSEFEYNEAKTKSGTRFRVWTREDALNQTQYALSAGVKALEFFEEYYNITFPLEKQDMMAFPDFAAGAMENWGLVMYREKYLLYDPTVSTPRQKLDVATVVAHELAHQWFGNLVTMKWWNDLWLNEGFATLMESLGANAISDGKFRMEEFFLYDSLGNAFFRDSRATSHPLHFPIDKAEDVSQAFDSITYDKGGSILRMVREILGAEKFQKGLNIYLNHYKYKNAEHKDLWASLNEVVPDNFLAWNGDKFDVNDFASKWTEQMGYPVIEIRRLDAKRVELHQRRFKMDDQTLEKAKFRNAKFWYKWDIPIWYAVNGEEKQMTWLHEAQSIDLGMDDLLVLNTQSRGFYRVNYNKPGWNRIIDQLLKDHTVIDIRSRARIIDDAFTLAEANQLPYETVLNLTRYLVKETEMLPWALALDGINTLLQNFGDEPEVAHLRTYIKSLVAPVYDKINWDLLKQNMLDDEKFFDNELQYAIIRKYCDIRQADCTGKVLDLFQEKFLEPCAGKNKSSQCSQVPVPVRKIAYCEGVSLGGDAEFDTVFKMYQEEPVQVERERLMHALSCSRDTFSLKKLLAMASDINSTVIRLQDKPSIFHSIGDHPVGKNIIFGFFQDNWERIYESFKDQQTLMSNLITASISLSNQRDITQYENFLRDHRRSTRNLDVFKMRLELAKTNKEWIDRHFKELSEWFEKQNQKQQ